MTAQPLTDHDRLLAAEARVAELEGELVAIKAAAQAEALSDARAFEEFRVARALRQLIPESPGVPATARLVIFLLAHAGRLCRMDALLRAVATSDNVASNIVSARICYLRRALRMLGHGKAIVTVRHQGFVLEAAAAPLIAAALGIGHE